MLDKLSDIKDDIIFIAENGALVKKGDEELSSTPLNRTVKDELLNIVSAIDGAQAMLCGKYKAYFDQDTMLLMNQLTEYYSAYEVVENYADVNKEIVKIAVYHAKSAEDFIYPRVAHLEDSVKVKVSGQYWLDLNDAEAHKGNALKRLIDEMGIKPHEVLAFGDYNNDIEMLQLVGHSFAMANAHPNVKEIVKYQTLSNNELGVETILEKLI